jgi:hypothetical protein
VRVAQEVAAMRPDGWYPDPGHSHELRYLDHDQWTAFVSDHGLVAQEPLTIRRRRRWPWVVGGVAAVLVLLAGTLVAVGLDRELDDLDVYVADLTATTDAGFPTSSSAQSVREYGSTGYRMGVFAPNTVTAAGIVSPTVHTVLALKVDVVPREVPAAAEFGVQCWQSETSGYGLLVSSGGEARLVSGSVATHEVTTLASATVDPLRSGVPRTLTLACDVIGDEAILAGYVDGVRVLSTRAPNDLTEITAGGMVVWARSAVPASWTVTRYERMGVHNMPTGWRDSSG